MNDPVRTVTTTCKPCDGEGWYYWDNGHGQPERHRCGRCDGGGKVSHQERLVTKWVRM